MALFLEAVFARSIVQYYIRLRSVLGNNSKIKAIIWNTRRMHYHTTTKGFSCLGPILFTLSPFSILNCTTNSIAPG